LLLLHSEDIDNGTEQTKRQQQRLRAKALAKNSKEMLGVFEYWEDRQVCSSIQKMVKKVFPTLPLPSKSFHERPECFGVRRRSSIYSLAAGMQSDKPSVSAQPSALGTAVNKLRLLLSGKKQKLDAAPGSPSRDENGKLTEEGKKQLLAGLSECSNRDAPVWGDSVWGPPAGSYEIGWLVGVMKQISSFLNWMFRQQQEKQEEEEDIINLRFLASYHAVFAMALLSVVLGHSNPLYILGVLIVAIVGIYGVSSLLHGK